MNPNDNPQAHRQGKLAIAPITPHDLPAICDMLAEFAIYEQVRDSVQASAADLERAMFGGEARLLGFIASKDGDAAGMILGYETYSTFSGRKRLFVEDLYVRATCRGSGLGRALLAGFAQHALAMGCTTVQWRVLEVNTRAIHFYSSLGAAVSIEHRNCSLSGETLQALASDGGISPPADFRFATNNGRFAGRLS